MSTQSLPRLYSSLQEFIGQTLPDRCRTRVANVLWMMSGIFLSGSVQLNQMARKVPLRAKKLSTVKRFSRFLDNEQVQARIWYEPFARWLLASAGRGGQIHLIIDTTKVAFNYRLVMLSVAYRRRSLPLAWTWVKGIKGHSTSQAQAHLLETVQDWFPATCRVSLVGDCEFGRGTLLLSKPNQMGLRLTSGGQPARVVARQWPLAALGQLTRRTRLSLARMDSPDPYP